MDLLQLATKFAILTVVYFTIVYISQKNDWSSADGTDLGLIVVIWTRKQNL